MGILTILIFSELAMAQSPDWNSQLPGGRSSGYAFLEGKPEGVGIGAYFGRPLSLAASYYKGEFITQALIGMWLPDTYRFSLDQLYTVYKQEFGEYISLPVNAGIGGCYYINEKSDGGFFGGGTVAYNHFGLRFPINIAFNHSELAFDVYAEYVPTLKVKPWVKYESYGGLGIRFYPFNTEQ